MKKFSNRFLSLLTVVLLAAIPVFAQTTAALTGTVTSEGAPLPGVTVTVSSPNLQGTRTTITDVNGNYNIGALPPGDYTVRMELESMQTVTRTLRVGVAQTGRADGELRVSALAEAITVTASAPAVLETTEVQANIQADLIEDLPIGRTLQATTTLAPGVTTTGPAGAITISGALGADNLFLVNGAVTNENLRGQTHNLFIEDAIQETTVQTAGVSAEFGRFQGGVVNAITKSGGNEFSGSLRDSFTNPSWTDKTDFVSATGVRQPDPIDDITEVYEGTLGGRIIRDRLWFFGAGRYYESTRTPFFTRSSVSYTAGDEETRYEGKLTGQITDKHNLVGSYLQVETENINNCFISCFEESNLDASRTLPNDFAVLRYNGIFTDRFILEASYSEKNFAFEGSGGDFTDRVRGTWGYDGAVTGAFYGAPVFCGVCDAEERNNSTYGVKGTYYLATQALGSHNIVTGYENWAEQRLSNNYQSGSGYGISTYSALPSRGADGVLRPTIAPGDLIGYFPISQLSLGSDFVTDSFYINDKWDLNQNFSFNLGARFDVNDGVDSAGNTVADDSVVSPRLGMMYDILGDGRFRVNASYSKYVNRIAETIGGSSSAAGNPSAFYYEYGGPVISGVPTIEAFTRLFAWFDSVGGLNNKDILVGASVPGVNTRIEQTLVSPNVDEITLGLGTQIGSNGFIRGDYITREFNDFFITRRDRSTGQVTDSLGNVFDLGFVENTDLIERSYDAVQLQAGYRLGQRVNLGGNYTWSETQGNQLGETAGSGPVTDAILNYPEFRAFDRHNPTGFLTQDQTHKARAWASVDVPTPVGAFNVSVLQNFDSGTAYSLVAGVNSGNYVGADVKAAYVGEGQTAANVAYYFSDRGEFRFDDITSTNLALNYNLPIRSLGIFVQAELLNAFGEDNLVTHDTTVFTARNGASCTSGGVRCVAFNPFTETPVEGRHYVKGPRFGQATAATIINPATGAVTGSYQLPRTYRFSAGIRF